jgi:hypothetical protein
LDIGGVKLLQRTKTVARSVINDPEEHTTIDGSGAVRSIQAADLDIPEEELRRLWTIASLERLARTYWWYLSRVTLGLVRVHYREDERAVVFLRRPFVLLRFHPPEYDTSSDRGVVRWRIRDGLLVAQKDDGYLEIDVTRCAPERDGYARLHVEVEVANFYPALARPFRWFYVNTQSRIHVVVTHGFLRQLARLELEESAVGRFAEGGPKALPPEDVNVGSTPWRVVIPLAASFFALGWLSAASYRRNRFRRS